MVPERIWVEWQRVIWLEMMKEIEQRWNSPIVWPQASTQLCKKPLFRKLTKENEILGFITSFEVEELKELFVCGLM